VLEDSKSVRDYSPSTVILRHPALKREAESQHDLVEDSKIVAPLNSRHESKTVGSTPSNPALQFSAESPWNLVAVHSVHSEMNLTFKTHIKSRSQAHCIPRYRDSRFDWDLRNQRRGGGATILESSTRSCLFYDSE